MMRRKIKPGSLLLAATPLLLLGSCNNGGSTYTPPPCTDSHEVLIGESGSPVHGHGRRFLCEEDRGHSVQFQLTGIDHTHIAGFSKLEVGDALDGGFVGKKSSESKGHTHWLNIQGSSESQ